MITAYREYMVKLRHVKGRMFTREGRRLAEERHAFMVLFLKGLAWKRKGKSDLKVNPENILSEEEKRAAGTD